jgi:hypothetical protein
MANYNSPKPSWFKQALWWCAGSDPILLKVGSYSDQVKMACMGGTIVSTAVLAFLAGTYAIHTVFSQDINAEIGLFEYAFGLVWAVIIFNIDRFIVSSSPPNIDLTWTKKLGNAIPRIIMGVVISLIISKPLELKIFEKDIELNISQNQGKEFEKTKKDIESEHSNDLKNIDDKIEIHDKDLKKLDKEYVTKDSLYNVELRIITVGPKAKALMADRESVNVKIETVKKSRNSLINAKDSIIAFINKESEKESKSVKLGMRSLVNKIKISHEISPIISNMITLLFIILELTPIIFKILMEKAPYDFQMYNRNEIIKANNSIIEEEGKVISKDSKLLTENFDKERIRLREKFFREQEDLSIQFIEEQNRLKIEFDRNQEQLLNSNLQIMKAKNQKYLNESLYNIIDLEKEKTTTEALLRSESFANDKMELEINEHRRLSLLAVEKELIDTTTNAYKQNRNNEIANNSNREYGKQRELTKNTKSKSMAYIEDGLIKDKFWKPGENYSKMHILTKVEISEIIKSKDDNLIDKLYHNESNKIATDTKITQSRNSESILEWKNKNNNIEKFNLDDHKIMILHNETKEKIIQLATV